MFLHFWNIFWWCEHTFSFFQYFNGVSLTFFHSIVFWLTCKILDYDKESAIILIIMPQILCLFKKDIFWLHLKFFYSFVFSNYVMEFVWFSSFFSTLGWLILYVGLYFSYIFYHMWKIFSHYDFRYIFLLFLFSKIPIIHMLNRMRFAISRRFCDFFFYIFLCFILDGCYTYVSNSLISFCCSILFAIIPILYIFSSMIFFFLRIWFEFLFTVFHFFLVSVTLFSTHRNIDDVYSSWFLHSYLLTVLMRRSFCTSLDFLSI